MTMIRAEQAERIMQHYEAEYDNFLDKLRSKAKAKKQQADVAQANAQGATDQLKKAEAGKKKKLGEKAKDLLNKAGGVSGLLKTASNVTKYFQDDSSTPSDYQVGFGDDPKAPEEKKILGMPPVAFYIGTGVVVIGVIYAISTMMKKPDPNTAIVFHQPVNQQ